MKKPLEEKTNALFESTVKNMLNTKPQPRQVAPKPKTKKKTRAKAGSK
jgi:hypothetical protein